MEDIKKREAILSLEYNDKQVAEVDKLLSTFPSTTTFLAAVTAALQSMDADQEAALVRTLWLPMAEIEAATM